MTMTKYNGEIIRNLWDTVKMIGQGCAGLAAPQINVRQRICVIKQGSLVMINPEITQRSGKHPSVEACYSLPGYEAIIPRAKKIVLHFQNNVGEYKHLITEDFKWAVVIQHEIDHLNGILISDYVDGRHGVKGGLLVSKYNEKSSTTRAFFNQLVQFGPIVDGP